MTNTSSPVSSAKTAPFMRTRFTWLVYGMMAIFGFSQAVPFPAIPFIQEQLALSYTVTAMHFTLFAFASVLIGLFGDSIAEQLGNRTAQWAAATTAGLGLVIMALGTTPYITIAGTFVLGLGAALVATLASSTLSDEHGDNRVIPLTEASIVAGTFVALAPLVVGLSVRMGLGWRPAAYISILGVLVLFLAFGSTPYPTPLNKRKTDGSIDKRLPPLFWIYGAVLFLSMSVEWCLLSWSAPFLIEVVGIEPGLASSLVSVFAFAIVIGRIIGSWLVRQIEVSRLLLAAVIIILIGFPMFWQGTVPALSIVGLFIAGLGVANLFPLGLSAAMVAAGDNTTVASARVTVVGGLAVMISPQVLGTTADLVGIRWAFGVVVLLSLTLVVIILQANRMADTAAPVASETLG